MLHVQMMYNFCVLLIDFLLLSYKLLSFVSKSLPVLISQCKTISFIMESQNKLKQLTNQSFLYPNKIKSQVFRTKYGQKELPFVVHFFHFIFHLLSSPACFIVRRNLYLNYHFPLLQIPLPSCNLLGPIPSIRQKIINGSAKLKRYLIVQASDIFKN